MPAETTFLIASVAKWGMMASLLLFFAMLLVFALLNIRLAYVGVLLAIIGYTLISKSSRHKTGSKGHAKLGGFTIHGSPATFMIFGGILIALFDIAQNGKPIYADAKHATATVVVKATEWALRAKHDRADREEMELLRPDLSEPFTAIFEDPLRAESASRLRRELEKRNRSAPP